MHNPEQDQASKKRGRTAGISRRKRRLSDDRRRIDGVVVGRIDGLEDDGRPRVSYPGDGGIVNAAASTVEVGSDDVGRDVALCFERGVPSKPMIIGFMWMPDPDADEAEPEPQILRVESGQDHILIEADKEITLKCGASSITLTRAGKIILRGKYVSSSSSGVNRIKGGSVQIN